MKSMRPLNFILLLCTVLALGSCSGMKTNKKKGGDLNMGASSQEITNADTGDFKINVGSDSGDMPIKTVYFAFNSSRLNSTGRSVLEGNAKILKAVSSLEVQIEGHCDERGGVQYNMALGERRAKTVRDYLVAMGVPRSRVSTVTLGKEQPVSFGHDEESWGKNRRGNFVITAK